MFRLSEVFCRLNRDFSSPSAIVQIAAIMKRRNICWRWSDRDKKFLDRLLKFQVMTRVPQAYNRA